MNRQIHGLAALLLAFGLTSTASAGHSAVDAAPSATLRYTASELRNPAGARHVYQRLQLIAERVCEAEDGPGLEHKVRHAQCLKTTVDGAVARLDAPLVKVLHEGRANGSAAVAWAGR